MRSQRSRYSLGRWRCYQDEGVGEKSREAIHARESVPVTTILNSLPTHHAQTILLHRYKTPVFIVQGGCCAHNAPHIVTDPDMDLSRVGWAQPDDYCMCASMEHDCSKHITGFLEKFKGWLHDIVLT